MIGMVGLLNSVVFGTPYTTKLLDVHVGFGRGGGIRKRNVKKLVIFGEKNSIVLLLV